MDSIVSGVAAGMTLKAMDEQGSEQPKDISIATAPDVALSDKRFVNEKVIGIEEGLSDYPEFGEENWKGKTAEQGEEEATFDDEDIIGVNDVDTEEAGFEIYSVKQEQILDEGERIVSEPDDIGADSQYDNVGTSEGLDEQEIDMNRENDFYNNFNNTWNDGKEMDVFMHYFTNPKVDQDEWAKTHKGEFESLKAYLKILVEKKLAEIDPATGRFRITPPKKRPIASFIEIINNLPNGKIGSITTTVKENKRIKSLLKKHIKELIEVQKNGNSLGQSPQQIEERLRAKIQELTGENIPRNTLTAAVQGAQLVFEQVGEEPDEPPNVNMADITEGGIDVTRGGIVEDLDLLGLMVNPDADVAIVPGNVRPGAGRIDFNDWVDTNEELIENAMETGARRGFTQTQVLHTLREEFARAVNIEVERTPPIPQELVIRFNTTWRQILNRNNMRDPAAEAQTETGREPQLVGIPQGPPQEQGMLSGPADINRVNPPAQAGEQLPQLTTPDYSELVGAGGTRAAAAIATMQEAGFNPAQIDQALASGGLNYAQQVQQMIADSLKPKKTEKPEDDPSDPKKNEKKKKLSPRKGKPNKKSYKFSDGTAIDPDTAVGKRWFNLVNHVWKWFPSMAPYLVNLVGFFKDEEELDKRMSWFTAKRCTFGFFLTMGSIMCYNYAYNPYRILTDIADLLARDDINVSGVIFSCLILAGEGGYGPFAMGDEKPMDGEKFKERFLYWCWVFFKVGAGNVLLAVVKWFAVPENRQAASDVVSTTTTAFSNIFWIAPYLLLAMGVRYVWEGSGSKVIIQEQEARNKKGVIGSVAEIF